VDAALRAAQRRAQESPADGAARLAYADRLFQMGLRAAAWLEYRAAEALGHPLDDLDPRRIRFRTPRPDQPLWVFDHGSASSLDPVAPLDDARVPSALVRSGLVKLPLVVILGEPCRLCDTAGTVCAECHGTGRCPDSIDNYEYDPWGMATCRCDGERERCRDCAGTQFKLRSAARPCGHDDDRVEWTDDDRSLTRCAKCGLASLHSGGRVVHACPRCALLDCGCDRGTLDT
jgi:hypothetical protein